MQNKHIAFLLTGSNLGNRKEHLMKAKAEINEKAGAIVNFSKFYETAAWGKEDQADFLNQAIQINTDLAPFDLLDVLLQIELSLGRTRDQKWDARTIDIDILLYNDLILNSEKLTIPHAHMHKRNFTLIPMLEIAAEVEHPVFKKPIETLYWESKDPLDVYQLEIL